MSKFMFHNSYLMIHNHLQPHHFLIAAQCSPRIWPLFCKQGSKPLVMQEDTAPTSFHLLGEDLKHYEIKKQTSLLVLLLSVSFMSAPKAAVCPVDSFLPACPQYTYQHHQERCTEDHVFPFRKAAFCPGRMEAQHHRNRPSPALRRPYC